MATGSRLLESAVAGRRGQRNGAPDCDAYPEGSGGSHSRRNSPSLLPGRCSMSSSRLVAAGAARGAGVLLAKGSGTGPAAVRGGSRNALCLQGVSALFCLRRSFGGGCGVVAPDGIMLPVERAGLAQTGAAAQFGSRHDAGPALFRGQGMAILAGGGAELRSPVTLPGCAGVSRFDVQVPALLSTAQIPDPVAAAATLAAEIEALSPRAEVWAAAASVDRAFLMRIRRLWSGGRDWHGCFHGRPRGTC